MVYVGKTKKFRDPIHGYIEIPDIIVSKIIDTELFQRLKYIEQTSMRPLYPAARHDRFIHSLGVYWLGKQAFTNFRKNAYAELHGESWAPTKVWWDKQEILFSLACLLHDCAHAPFSHTLENLYILRKKKVSVDILQNLNLDDAYSNKFIPELDYKLISACVDFDKSFSNDFMKTKGMEIKGGGAPHEKMSAFCAINEYGNIIPEVVDELLGKTKLENDSFQKDDFVFIVRMIIGCKYEKTNVETSLKNCIISMLNSSSIDVDGLDYIVRDSYMSGIDNFSIDYKRLLSSFTIIPLEVFEKEKINEKNIDGIWLYGSEFIIRKFKTESLKGKIEIKDLSQEYSEKIHSYDKDKDYDANLKILYTDSLQTISFEGLREGILQCGESCEFKGSEFTGTITGKKVLYSLENNSLSSSKREYILGYEKNCLSVIQSVIEARNLEYTWVYSHPKVLYSCNYLLSELLRDSARYLCCCENNINFKTEKLSFNCEKCAYYRESESGKAEEDYILYILGYETYFNKNYEEVDQFKQLIDKGFIFYRSSDADLNALFKRINLENRKRKELKSDRIDAEFREYFSRQHRKALWKSFVEYVDFQTNYLENDDLRSALLEILKETVLDSSIYNYGRFDDKKQSILNKYGVKNALVIKSKINTKELNQQETYIRFKNQTKRLIDIPSLQKKKEARASNNFYYIFANKEQDLNKEDYNQLIKELDDSMVNEEEYFSSI